MFLVLTRAKLSNDPDSVYELIFAYPTVPTVDKLDVAPSHIVI